MGTGLAWGRSQAEVKQFRQKWGVYVDRHAIREREKAATPPDPFFNHDWQSLRVGDEVKSLVDDKIAGKLIRIANTVNGFPQAYLAGHRRSFCIVSLVKV